jgi:hypothetical protein
VSVIELRKPKVIKRDESQDRVRRHNIALMKLLAELMPREFKQTADEVARPLLNEKVAA